MQLTHWLALLMVSCLPFAASAQQVGQTLPVWREGELEIHHINTGRGNATFAILPDGTTLLIDAGSVNPIDWRTNKPRNLPLKPTGERQAGEWIARYIRNVLRFQQEPVLDYAVITHFHDDHMGSPLHMTRKAAQGYTLTGITEVAEYIPVRKIIDRGWPDYAYPRSFANDSMVLNYRQFLDAQIRLGKSVVERFQAGRNDQLTLLKQPNRYRRTFQIRNLAVNGEIWTGKDQSVRKIFPDLATLSTAQYPNENMCSIAFEIRYGTFRYFNGGDIPGVLQFGEPVWHDVETPLAEVAGPVSVQLLDHHGYEDSENGTLLAKLRPRVFVIPAWATLHPARSVLERIFSNQIYTGERDVFVTNLLDETKSAIGNLASSLKSAAGHIVIKVDSGGKTFRVVIVDDTTESLQVKAVHGPYQSH